MPILQFWLLTVRVFQMIAKWYVKLFRRRDRLLCHKKKSSPRHNKPEHARIMEIFQVTRTYSISLREDE